jgi:hypothetical protein
VPSGSTGLAGRSVRLFHLICPYKKKQKPLFEALLLLFRERVMSFHVLSSLLNPVIGCRNAVCHVSESLPREFQSLLRINSDAFDNFISGTKLPNRN